MNNKIDSNNIDKSNDHSRVYGDNVDRVEKNDGSTEFTNNLVDYYNTESNKSKNMTKEEKTEVVNGLLDKIKNSFKLFFNTKKVKSEEEYINRCKNASKITILFLVVVVLDFLIYKGDFLNMLTNIGCLIVLAMTIVSLRTGKKNGVLYGVVGGVLILLTFNIIRIVFGLIYIFGILCLMNCKEEEKKPIDNNNKQ